MAESKKKLAERLGRPHVEAASLRGMPDCYKIKLKNAGYRLVYQVKVPADTHPLKEINIPAD
jgi:mRNA-degrading endonuclease RelE of RelBE toxin-antitoxin system